MTPVAYEVELRFAGSGNGGFAAAAMREAGRRDRGIMIPAVGAAMLPIDGSAVPQQNGGCDGAARY